MRTETVEVTDGEGRIDVRGVGIAGSPGVLIFWNRHVAQTATAGGGDLVDLFEITPGRAADTYVVDGAEVPFDGDYWLGATYGAAAFMEAGASDVWVLDSACAQPSC